MAGTATADLSFSQGMTENCLKKAEKLGVVASGSQEVSLSLLAHSGISEESDKELRWSIIPDSRCKSRRVLVSPRLKSREQLLVGFS